MASKIKKRRAKNSSGSFIKADQDYISSLPDAAQQYIKKFNREYYKQIGIYDKDAIHQDPKLRKASRNARTAAEREVAVSFTDAPLDLTAQSPLDAIIELIDKKNNSSDSDDK